MRIGVAKHPLARANNQKAYREYDGWLTRGHIRVQLIGDLDYVTGQIRARLRFPVSLDDIRDLGVGRDRKFIEVGMQCTGSYYD